MTEKVNKNTLLTMIKEPKLYLVKLYVLSILHNIKINNRLNKQQFTLYLIQVPEAPEVPQIIPIWMIQMLKTR